MDITTTAQLVNAAISSIRNATEIAKSLNSYDLKLALSGVLDDVLEIKIRLVELDEENRQLKLQLETKTNQREVDSDELLHLKVKMRGATDLINAADIVLAIHHFFSNRKTYLRSETISTFLAKYPNNFREQATYGQPFDDEVKGMEQLRRDVDALELPNS